MVSRGYPRFIPSRCSHVELVCKTNDSSMIVFSVVGPESGRDTAVVGYEGTETRYRCDQCGRRLSVPGFRLGEDAQVDSPVLPDPWRKVHLTGWAGSFHACSEKCECAIRERYER